MYSLFLLPAVSSATDCKRRRVADTSDGRHTIVPSVSVEKLKAHGPVTLVYHCHQ